MPIDDKTSFRPGILMISLSLHLILMAAFAMIQFSRGKFFQSLSDSPKGAIRTLEAIQQAGIVVPKPSVRERGVSSAAGSFGGIFGDTGSGEGDQAGSGRGSGGTDADNTFASATAASAASVLAQIQEGSPSTAPGNISFFGNVASERKVCFVVDCSGSMLGFFGQVKDKLVEVISSLKQDNFYGVVVFRGEQLIEVEPEKLLRASDSGKRRAFEFIDSIGTPAGRPDAFEALKKAIRYTDGIGDSPGVVYFLTDGFDYDGFAAKIEEYRSEYAPVVKIHTIGFMVNQRDEKMLKTIASESGGKFTMYSGGVN
jgi:hypothetical protein